MELPSLGPTARSVVDSISAAPELQRRRYRLPVPPNPTPAISILCPAYRTEAYIGQAIDSVLAQTTGDWELVVVDNGLSDAVAGVVTSYDDPRIRLLRQPNRGMDGGFSAAADAAAGRYFLVLSSDDLLTPGACALLTAFLDRHPQVDAVAGDAFVFDESRAMLHPESLRVLGGRRRRPDPSRAVTFTEVLGGRVLFAGAAFRRAAWESVGGFRAGDASDLALWLMLLRAGHDVREIPEKVAVCRQRPGSVSRSDDPERYADGLERACAAALEGTDDPALWRAMDRRVRYLRYHSTLGMARTALRDGDVAGARRWARAARGHRRTARSLGVVAALAVAPGLLRRVHPARDRVTTAALRAMTRLTRAERGAAGVRTGRSPSGSA